MRDITHTISHEKWDFLLKGRRKMEQMKRELHENIDYYLLMIAYFVFAWFIVGSFLVWFLSYTI